MGFWGLRYYLVAAEEMNFRRAAEKLHITQQTLSVHIQKLEREYGVQLFERKPHLTLTPAGLALIEYARRVLQLERQFKLQLADISDTSTGYLRVGITGIRGTIFIPRICGIFREKFPNIVLSLTEASTAKLDEMLGQGILDLYIGVDAPVRSGTKVWTLSQEKICCIASPELVNEYFYRGGIDLPAKAAHEGLELSDLVGMPMIAFTRPNSLREILEEFYANCNTRPHIVLETSRHDLVLRLCQQGYGVGLIYQMILYDLLSNARSDAGMFIFPMKNLVSPKCTSLVCRRESFQPRFMAGFIRMAQGVFKDYAENADTVIRGALTER